MKEIIFLCFFVLIVCLNEKNLKEQEINEKKYNMYQVYKAHLSSSEEDFMLLLKSADLGFPKAQHELAAAYFTGVSRGLIPVDIGRALLLSYFAALSGDATANMALGYRYLYGEGVPENCETALVHYEYAANEAALQIEKRGYPLPIERNRLSDDTAAAVRSSGAAGSEVDLETLDYFSQLAEDGDMNSAMTLASIYISGYKNIPIDMKKAVKYLTIAADSGWNNAQGQLGYLLATAPEGVTPDPQRAFSLLTMADKRQDSMGTVGLGYCYFKGIGTAVNLTKAYDLLQKVAGKHVEASFYMGEILMGVDPANPNDFQKTEIAPNDLQAAVQYYSQASARGHILATHRLGHLQSTGYGIPRSCAAAVSSFKIVAERGDWSSELSEAYNNYENGQTLQALITYSIYASMGVETAQANAAFILAKGMCPIPLGLVPIEDMKNRGVYFNSTQWYLNFTTETNLEAAYIAACEARALSLYRQSAVQGNADGYLKVGDMHYYGMGGLPKNKKNAALYYQMAADMRHTHAMFNLGLMHEAGDGVDQDFHLAKRYYDQVAEFDKEAQLPSFLAVSFLQFHKSFQARFGKETSDHVGDILVMLSTPLNIVSKIKNLPIVRRALGKYSGEIAFLHSGGNKISDLAENTWSFAVYFKGYCERFIDRMKKSPLGTLSILFRSEPKSPSSSSSSSSSSSHKKSISKYFVENENEMLILLILIGLFIVILDVRRQRARRRQIVIEENEILEFLVDDEVNDQN